MDPSGSYKLSTRTQNALHAPKIFFWILELAADPLFDVWVFEISIHQALITICQNM